MLNNNFVASFCESLKSKSILILRVSLNTKKFFLLLKRDSKIMAALCFFCKFVFMQRIFLLFVITILPIYLKKWWKSKMIYSCLIAFIYIALHDLCIVLFDKKQVLLILLQQGIEILFVFLYIYFLKWVFNRNFLYKTQYFLYIFTNFVYNSCIYFTIK